MLGKAGRPVVHAPEHDVWLRPLADGSWAIAQGLKYTLIGTVVVTAIVYVGAELIAMV